MTNTKPVNKIAVNGKSIKVGIWQKGSVEQNKNISLPKKGK
jgi:hypothetical protein